ncbi:MAG TPA: thiamine phosphate synthase [Acidobacteriota bacterium]|nr:thiamine phosphate synthase [Acidobacteriota bacterium]
MTHPQPKPLDLPPLYPLLGSRPQAPSPIANPVLGLAQACLEGGAKLLQFREKPPAGDADLSRWQETAQDTARRLARLCHQHQALLIINDHVGWVRPCGAGGVHVGQDDLDPRHVRRMLGKGALIGYSTHDEEQFRRAQDLPIDYVALGPIFPSPTKPDAHPTVGLERLEELAAWSRLPVVAIGGITLEQAPAVWRSGAASVALISDITDHPHPASRVRAYLKAHERLPQT